MASHRRSRVTAITAALLCGCLALAAWIHVRDSAAAPDLSAALIQPSQASGPAAAARPGARTALSVKMPLTACEARIEGQRHPRPTVAIVGASYTAGTGPGNPDLSWAVLLARQLRWNAVIYGAAGAGYVREGYGRSGTVQRMLRAEGLRRLDPALVLVQAGFDDIGVSAELEKPQVEDTVELIRAAAPRARIGLLTTFGFTPRGTPLLRRTDRAIITAGRAADPGAIVMDPLGGRWTFQRADFGGGLHPSAAGDAWIAGTVAAILRAHGVRSAPATSTAPVICDVAVGADAAQGDAPSNATALRQR